MGGQELIAPCYVCDVREGNEHGLCPVCMADLAAIAAGSDLRFILTEAMSAGMRGTDASTAINAYVRHGGLSQSDADTVALAEMPEHERNLWLAERYGIDGLRVAVRMQDFYAHSARLMQAYRAL